MAQDQPLHEPAPATAGTEPDLDLLQHIEALGLKTVEEYVAWCGRHGFSRRTKKNWRNA